MSEEFPDLSGGAFGLAALGSAEGADQSRRLMASADNLLGKASRALEVGDAARARRFVDRAMALPFDDHEEVHPAWWSAHMALHTLVVDEVEESVADDHLWLTAAERLLAVEDGAGALSLRQVLGTVGESVALTPYERTRCAELSGGHTEDGWWDAPPAEVTADVVLDVLRVADAYEDALLELGPDLD